MLVGVHALLVTYVQPRGEHLREIKRKSSKSKFNFRHKYVINTYVLFENKVVPVQPIAFETPLTVMAAPLEESMNTKKINKVIKQNLILELEANFKLKRVHDF